MHKMAPWGGPSLSWKCVCKGCMVFTRYSPPRDLGMSVPAVGYCDLQSRQIFAYKLPPCVQWEYKDVADKALSDLNFSRDVKAAEERIEKGRR